MSTLPPPGTKFFPPDSMEKKVYNITEKFSDFIPITNDRNRLGYNLLKYINGEGDAPSVLVKTLKLKIVGISDKKLAEQLNSEIEEIKKIK
jgi:hypothetical protein